MFFGDFKNFKNLKKTFFTFAKPLMMAYEGSKNAQDYFGEFIYQLQPKPKYLSRNLKGS